MSSFVMDKKEIDILTCAVGFVLAQNKKYPASYPLSPETLNLFSDFADSPAMIYRGLYDTNIRAVMGRYGEDAREAMPEYTGIRPWDNPFINDMKKAAGYFGCYMYQISEDPVIHEPIFSALSEIQGLLCKMLCSCMIDWNGNKAERGPWFRP